MNNPSALVVPSEITRISPFPSGITLLPSQIGASTPAPAELTNAYSVDFDGTNDYMAINDGFLTSYGSDTQGTVSAWVYCHDVSASSFPIFTCHNNNITKYFRFMQFEGRLWAGLWDGAWDWILDTDNSDLSVNTWHHVAVTHNGTTPVLYVDGVATDQAFTISTDITAWLGSVAVSKAEIGAFTKASQWFDGLIDEPAYFSGSALSASQISDLYNSGAPSDLTSLSPAGWWRMGDNDGGAGTTITDQGSGSNDGTLTNGPVIGSDVPVASLPELTNTYSIDFDGTNDYMAIDSVATSYASDTTGTISAWIKMDDATPAAASYIFSVSDASAGTFTALYVNPEGRLTFAVQKTGTNQVIVRTDPTAFSDNTWYHVAVVQDGVLPVVYIDGSAPTQSTLVSTDTTAFLGDLTGLDVSTVGALRYLSSTSLYFAGLIDEVSYFSGVALNASQVSDIYNSGTPTDLTSDSPAGWWRMGDNDGGTGTTVTDQGSGGNNATLTNGPTFSSDVAGAPLAELTNTYSVDFDGTNDYMSADGAASAASGFTGGTWMAWVAPDDATPNIGNTIISFGDDDANSYLSIEISGISQTDISATCLNAGTQQWTIKKTNIGWSDTDWHHVAIVHNGTDAIIYVDGVSIGATYTLSTDKTVWHSGIAGLDKFTVGAQIKNGGESLRFNGKIDEVAICETQLTAANLLEIASATTAKAADLSSYSPVGWWRMGDNDGGTGTTVTDQGSGSNNGTLTNGPTFSTTVQ